MLKIFSSFTGIGSPEMALRNIGVDYDVVGISEVDKYAILAYNAIHDSTNDVCLDGVSHTHMIQEMSECNIAYNFSTGKSEMPTRPKDVEALYKAHRRSSNFGDIRTIDVTTLPDFDLFSYSFPCKNISITGKQAGCVRGSGTQSSLLWECQRIIDHSKPKYLLMENVKNLVGVTHKESLDEWVEYLNGLGYTSKYAVLNACNYGLPQNRERVIMISSLNGEVPDFDFGVPTDKSVCDIVDINADATLWYQDDEVNLEIPNNIESGKLTLVGHLSKFKIRSNTRIYSADGYAPTLNSMNGGNRQPHMAFKDGVARKLNPLECWRLMGYSDEDYTKASTVLSNARLYERAGRGIAVPMLENVLSILFRR